MRENSRFGLTILTVLILYIGLSAAFYFDVISAYVVVGVLFLLMIASWIMLFRFRKEKAKAWKMSVLFLAVVCLFIFDLSLLNYEQMAFKALVHEEPVDAAADSEIHLMSVGTVYFSHIEDKESLIKNFERGNKEFFQIDEVDNKARYHRRNASFLQLVGIRKDEFSVMAKDVRGYLGNETEGVGQFLESDGNAGDSAGLGLALTGLIEQNKLENYLEFGVTGAMNAQGKISGIGMVKEKLLIAEKEGYPFMIIPSDNAEEAEEVKKAQNLGIQIFAVGHVDEAVELIEQLNGAR